MKLIAAPAIFYWATALFCINSSAQTAPQSAASYPSKPIRMVVSFTPGGGTDILARAIGLELTKAWSQPVVIDNVPGARSGNGSAAKLSTEYFKLQTGTSLLHIPYRGTAPTVTDLMGGKIQVLFTGAPAVQDRVKIGQLRAIAVSSPTRLNNKGAVTTPSTPEVFGELIVNEIARWKPVMTSGRVKAD